MGIVLADKRCCTDVPWWSGASSFLRTTRV